MAMPDAKHNKGEKLNAETELGGIGKPEREGVGFAKWRRYHCVGLSGGFGLGLRRWANLTFARYGTSHALMRRDDGLTLGGSHDNAIYLISHRGRRPFW
jgi:hypothetical protein